MNPSKPVALRLPRGWQLMPEPGAKPAASFSPLANFLYPRDVMRKADVY